MAWELYRGDCLEMMAAMEPCSVDALICDPPYGLGKPPPIEDVLRAWLEGERYQVSGGGFMGRKWDAFVPGPHFWRLAFAAMKPGAHGVVFAGQRTVDVMGIALRLAGFQVRDLVGWQYWSGFPKSHDVSKAIDRAAGAEREVVGMRRTAKGKATAGHDFGQGGRESSVVDITAPATPDAARFEAYGTALKPCIEPALLVRKPLEGTVAANVLRWGTGGLNVDGCRYAFGDPAWPGPQNNDDLRRPGNMYRGHIYGDGDECWSSGSDVGRWPANVYVCPKASTAERERGCDGLAGGKHATTGKYGDSVLRCPEHGASIPSGANGQTYACGCRRMWRTGAEAVGRKEGSAGLNSPRAGAGRTSRQRLNFHPTVKPVKLLRWLSRLCMGPDGGTVLDPFAGSGSCGVAAVLEGFDYVGAELEADYQPIALARIGHAVERPDLWIDTRPGPPVDEATAEEAEATVAGQIGMFGGGE